MLSLGMRLICLLAATLSVSTSCSRETDAAKAERAYQIVKSNSANAEEICAAARRVAQAWLDEGDAQKYRDAALRRDLDCNQALLNRL